MMESHDLNNDGNNNKLSTSSSGSSAHISETKDNTTDNPNSFSSFIEPPSYAEAIFRSFDHDQGDQINDQDDASTSSPVADSDYLKITVTNPQTEVDAGKTYVTYLISTSTNLQEFNVTAVSVRRRFSEVVMLSDRLSESYRGYFVPVRPDKGVVESKVMQKCEFVEMRRIELERYFGELADHPVIRKSEDLRVFLQVQGKLPFVTRDNAVVVSGSGDVMNEAKEGRNMVRMFKELRQSVTYGWGATKPPLVEEDFEFLKKRKKLQGFEVQLNNVALQAESLVKAQQDIEETMGDLGMAFVKLTAIETREAVFISQHRRAADMKNMATCVVKQSRLYRELNAQTIKHLGKLHEYLGVMLSVNNAYSDRSNALLAVQTLVSEVSTLNSRIEKLKAVALKVFGGERLNIQKIEELTETMKVTEDAKNLALKEYERIKEINKTEFERIDKERREDFVGMLKGFVVNQVGYAEMMASAWETVEKHTRGYAQSCN
ncbi:sorting nexin 2B-like [Rutidosis leptorrhynchoides]|uniref:sorting nexin 2B-like n=1 Tax=Rutidosis leptorrhynchoides TaxID=125765 RepID=UPI003A9950F4